MWVCSAGIFIFVFFENCFVLGYIQKSQSWSQFTFTKTKNKITTKIMSEQQAQSPTENQVGSSDAPTNTDEEPSGIIARIVIEQYGKEYSTEVVIPVDDLPEPKELDAENRNVCANFYAYIASRCTAREYKYRNNWTDEELDQHLFSITTKVKRKTKKQLKEEEQAKRRLSDKEEPAKKKRRAE
jgi:hypothetical protein